MSAAVSVRSGGRWAIAVAPTVSMLTLGATMIRGFVLQSDLDDANAALDLFGSQRRRLRGVHARDCVWATRPESIMRIVSDKSSQDEYSF